MTTPPTQNQNQNNRGRKRPAPGSSAPIPTSTPGSAAPLAAETPDMNYLNLGSNGNPSAGAGANIYPNGSVLAGTAAEPYRNGVDQATSTSQAAGLNNANDHQNQLARINRSANSLVRMPQYTVNAGASLPQGLAMPTVPMMMNGVGVGSMGMGQVGVIGGASQNDGMDPFDRELQLKIEKMRKKRASIPPFVQKLSSFVNDPKTDPLIRWSPSGNSFVVIDEDEFSKTLIPDLFKHNNYASFVRQLNMYGFHKVVGLADGSLKTSEQRSKPPSEYENAYFKRGQPDLMWLIQKPKNPKKARPKKGVKAEQQNSDDEDNMSDGGGGNGDFDGGGGGYIEGPKQEGQNDGHHQGGGRGSKPDIQVVIQQLEAVRNHQAMISAAINRLRKDHNQLYEQSVAFQTLHDRHENSINAILTFLATVYDKSLGGHINGAFNNLFAPGQVEHGQGMHPQGGGSVGPVVGNSNGSIISSGTPVRPNGGVMRTPQVPGRKRPPLLLENGPSSEDGSQGVDVNISGTNNSSGKMKQKGSPVIQNYQTYQSPSIQELFTHGTGPLSPVESPSQLQSEQLHQNHQQQHQHQHQQHHQQQQHATNRQSPSVFSPIFSLPDSPVQPTLKQTSSPAPSQLTPCTLGRTIGTSVIGSQAIQEHNAQLAQKSLEIEELEELQTVQNSNVDDLMDMMRNFAEDEDNQSANNNNNSSNNNTSAPASTNVDSISPIPHDNAGMDDFLNWYPTNDFTDHGGGGGNHTNGGVSYLDGTQPVAGIDDINELFSFPGGMDSGTPTSMPGNGGGSGAQVSGDSSKVVDSPVGNSSVGSRAREELDEEVEEVGPKRRKLA